MGRDQKRCRMALRRREDGCVMAMARRGGESDQEW